MKILLSTLLSLILLSTSVFAKVEIKKFKNKNIEVIKFQVPDRKLPGKDDVLAQIHFPKKTNYFIKTLSVYK